MRDRYVYTHAGDCTGRLTIPASSSSSSSSSVAQDYDLLIYGDTTSITRPARFAGSSRCRIQTYTHIHHVYVHINTTILYTYARPRSYDDV